MEMKAYSFKWNKKSSQFVFTDIGRHIVRFNSFEEQMNEMIKFFHRKDISIRISFEDSEGKEQMRKVQFQKSCVLMKTKDDDFRYCTRNDEYCFEQRNPKKSDKSYTFHFPLNSGWSIYLWYEKVHNGKCVAMYGRDRMFAKPIDRTKVKFYITYQE